MIQVTISSDPMTLGEAATRADLDSYRANLELHLCERFADRGRVVVVTRDTLGTRSDDETIGEYVRGLEQGDGWLQFLESRMNNSIPYASEEIFGAVFGADATRESILDAAGQQGVTPQDYAMTHILEARKCGLETDVDEAFRAVCFELGVAAG